MVERRRQTTIDNEVETFPSLVAVRFICHQTCFPKNCFLAETGKCCHFSLDAGTVFIDG
jgi:hypothetical protein